MSTATSPTLSSLPPHFSRRSSLASSVNYTNSWNDLISCQSPLRKQLSRTNSIRSTLSPSTSILLDQAITDAITQIQQTKAKETTEPSVSSQLRSSALPNPSFYKRQLPNSCIPFNSERGKQLFRRSLDSGCLESYFSLSMHFLTQAEPAFCGLASLCMILNALEVDPLRQWKGVWRWYDESLLDCCRPLDDIKQHGITLPEFTCLAKCNGLNVTTRRPDETTKQQFIDDVKRTCENDAEYMVVSYDRGSLGQTGTGHFSPIGGFDEAELMVLVLDVARFKYPPYWVKVDTLWEALHPVDTSTGKSRGYTILARGTKPYVSTALSQLAVNGDSWSRLSDVLFRQIPSSLVNLPKNTSLQGLISFIVSEIPSENDSIVEHRLKLFISPLVTEMPVDDGAGAASQDAIAGLSLEEYVSGLDVLLHHIARTEMYKLVSESMVFKTRGVPVCGSVSRAGSMPSSPLVRKQSLHHNEEDDVCDFLAFLTIFLYAFLSYQPMCDALTPALANQVKSIVNIDQDPQIDLVVKKEVAFLREQIAALNELIVSS
ncbi:hypothetical protein SmJEL517_g03309 [Synchytrium microbalum]|uniref:glutathione gamma-glutamylcysteinyltransferase n=1 Tax=Synchytrium microbalum TaxID=1806994 RepID=A0A507C707_9FUNG|nr:uncharacterized protein SmJEL517_g03309 [Synchytrium microbalum]TPX33844.1 hypothetical protein SmJEL517_g03309 [Synchytrium microbalum]